MSRQIDTSDLESLSQADLVYLAQRAQLPTDFVPVEDQRKVLDLSGAQVIQQYPNTGDVNVGFAGLGGLSTEELEQELHKRQKAAAQEDLGDRIGSAYPIDFANNAKKPFGTLPTEGGPSKLEQQLTEQAPVGLKLRGHAAAVDPDDDPEVEDDEDDGEEKPYAERTNAELRAELSSRGLSVDGRKDELVARLEEDDASSEDEE